MKTGTGMEHDYFESGTQSYAVNGFADAFISHLEGIAPDLPYTEEQCIMDIQCEDVEPF